MKLLMPLLLAFVFVITSVHAQSPLEKYAGAESLTPEQFADVVKAAWDELKKAADEYDAQLKSKNEFESTQEFQARMARERDAYWGKIVKFNTEQKLSEHTFPVLMNVQLRTYNADRRTYSLKSTSSIIVPPSGERVSVTLPSNAFTFIRESKRKGYRYAHIVMNTEPEFIWHVEPDVARAAKSAESNIHFKVWFNLDITQPIVNTTARLSIVPVKIALINSGSNTVYWTENISR